MEQIKQLFSKDTPRGRAVRTGVQAVIALTSFIIGLFAIPGVYQFVAQNDIVAVGTLSVWLGIVSYIYNAAEQVINWLGE